jgi:hypothetical protein
MANAFVNLQSKKKLRNLLYIDTKFRKLEVDGFFNNMYKIYIAKKTLDNGKVKRRLVESPRSDIKVIHKRILKLLSTIELPDYLYSKRGVSYLDNHTGHKKKYVVKMDISKFFPNCDSSKIYHFFKDELGVSNDCSFWLTKLISVDYLFEKINQEVKDYLEEVSNKQYFPIREKHLPTGSPLSPLLSFLVHKALFDGINEYCNSKGISFTLYVDDVTISSNNKISEKTIYDIVHYFHQFGLPVSKQKTVIYRSTHDKLITGVVVNRHNEVKVPNKLYKKRKDLKQIYNKTNDSKDFNRLQGVENAIKQILKRS